MVKETAGHYRIGIYHARKTGAGNWRVTVEDGRGFPFDPIALPSLKAFRAWCGE